MRGSRYLSFLGNSVLRRGGKKKKKNKKKKKEHGSNPPVGQPALTHKNNKKEGRGRKKKVKLSLVSQSIFKPSLSPRGKKRKKKRKKKGKKKKKSANHGRYSWSRAH